MCGDCFESEHNSFLSQSDFEEFEKVLDKKCWSKKNSILEGDNIFLDFRMYYQYNTCKEEFIMSIPNYADRGYFLTRENAYKHHIKLNESQKSRKIGCLILFIIALFFIVFYFLN